MASGLNRINQAFSWKFWSAIKSADTGRPVFTRFNSLTYNLLVGHSRHLLCITLTMQWLAKWSLINLINWTPNKLGHGQILKALPINALGSWRVPLRYLHPVLGYATRVWSPHLIKDMKFVESGKKWFTKCRAQLHHISHDERLR
jgi:hypothetical protein